ncbi:MAG: NADH-quinone oxidoreductase subunit K [Acidobacteriota bacterium]
MITVMALAVALLVVVGVELLLGRSLFKAILGLSLLAHAAHLLMIATGGVGTSPPVLDGSGSVVGTADPLPQALVLTAIVISMAVTLYLVGLLQASGRRLGASAVEPALASDPGREAADPGESDSSGASP